MSSHIVVMQIIAKESVARRRQEAEIFRQHRELMGATSGRTGQQPNLLQRLKTVANIFSAFRKSQNAGHEGLPNT